jgi:hypothetical protein
LNLEVAPNSPAFIGDISLLHCELFSFRRKLFASMSRNRKRGACLLSMKNNAVVDGFDILD